MKSTVLFAVAATLTACAFAGLAGAHTFSAAKTKVTIKGPNGDFQGKLFSVRKKCLANRKVTVFKQTGSTQNRSVDMRIGSDTSERHGTHGEWSIGNSGFKHGKFYAHAKRSSGCRGGSSPTIRI
jgi:hypothetical protein